MDGPGVGMARVEVPMVWVTGEPDELPRVCVLSGRTAEHTVTATYVHMPDWTYLLLLFGILPFIVASWFTTERVRLRLPVDRAALAQLRRLRRAGWVGVTAGLVVAVVGGTGLTDGLVGGSLVAGGVLLCAGVLALAACALRRPSARVDGGRVVLGRAHRGFVDAVRARRGVLTS